MTDNYGFCDLCLNYVEGDKKRLRELLLKVYSMGYATVAINQNIDEIIFESEKKKKKKGSVGEPVVCNLPAPLEIEDLINEFKGKLKILTRITFSFSDPVRTHSLSQSSLLQRYNIFAVLPKNKNAFQHACSQLNADLITLNLKNSGWKFTRKLYTQAVERGVHFEIKYAEVIQSATRKFAIHFAHLFYTFGKSKNVIISSGANDANLIRNPYDIVTLGSVLGLNEVRAKASILWQCRQLILKSQGRICGRTVFTIKCDHKESDSESEDSDREEESAAKKMKL
ncbi:ribonuclease P protein subunit p30 [Belonocnema kinseyi]|uniref:ribonuclease P protein subunit p30 n=1 Tax=Belonocnema kinseyi TaxID=2817044 RepID=UPI00143D2863|nr:ribonuclease P protein subunit p30 [Belonocnema kinseyi]